MPLSKIKQKVRIVASFAGSRSVLRDVAEITVNTIRNRVRLGYMLTNTSESASKRRYPLSPKYMNWRKKVKLGPFGSPRRSNLTLTGQMLEAMTYSINNNEINVFYEKSARAEIEKNDGTTIPQNITNQKVAELVSEKRPHLGLTRGERRIILREYEKKIRTIVNKLFL